DLKSARNPGDRQEVAFTYNSDGSLTAKSGADNASYTYGAFGRLEKVEKDGTTVSYQYCPLGKRIGRTFSGPNGSGSEKFYYINDNIFEIENDKGTRKVVLSLGIDEVFGETDNQGSTRYFFQDYLGSVKMEFDENGSVKTLRHYRAFGDEHYDRSSGFGFTGREWDDAAEIYFYRSRYYDPKTGRFLQRDTFNETAMLRGDFGLMHNPLQMNDWVYAGNKPVDFRDSFGSKVIGIGLVGTLGTGAMIEGGGLLIIDDKGNIGRALHFGFGGMLGIDIQAGGQIFFSDADLPPGFTPLLKRVFPKLFHSSERQEIQPESCN
ncbi:MAG: hypothetical protein PHQ23_14535, partial [Candidatus Wallbacteria bacterium]|nr:hypothetical protein [Candidatus Wallbacteria bacterium]